MTTSKQRAIRNDPATALIIIDKLKSVSEAKQAKIDSLMLEYCPDEMTKEQIENWEKHQVKSDIEI